jgi:hypothetical protein
MATDSTTSAWLPDSDDDAMRPVVEQWLDRTERRLRGRRGWAPPEPTRWLALNEAMAMTDYLVSAAASSDVTPPARPS